jgi:sirohydrochlorin cobaltochelatase
VISKSDPSIPGIRGRTSRRSILLVAFGTRAPEGRAAYDLIDRQTKIAFPGLEIRWAFTSRTVRASFASEGKSLDSPELALARLMAEGFTDIAVLSLHVIPGLEFHDLVRNAELFSRMVGGFDRVIVARPLLSSYDDMVRTASVMAGRAPAERGPLEAVLFMGHGSGKHPSDSIYLAMSHLLRDMAPDLFMATVDGRPSLQDVLPALRERQVSKIHLIPFMAVAGAHIRKDMAGEGPDSWKSVLERNGFSCEVVMTGMAEVPEIVDIWLGHLRDALERLDRKRAGGV